jgi:hypothetical protein
MRLAATLLLGSTLALAAPAMAGETASSSVTLKTTGSTAPVHGVVKSRNPACIANRKVKLLSISPQRGLIDFADNRTNGKGKWVFSSELQGATVVQAKVAAQKNAGVTCRAALSPAKRLR